MLNDKEYEQLKNAAFKVNMQLAVYVRSVALGYDIKPYLTVEQNEMLKQAQRMGNNLNQIAKKLHEEGVLKYAEEVESLITVLKKIMNHE